MISVSHSLEKVWPAAMRRLRTSQVIEELTVLDRPDPTVLARERLVAPFNVDDAEAPDTQGRSFRVIVPRSSGPRCVIASVMRSST